MLVPGIGVRQFIVRRERRRHDRRGGHIDADLLQVVVARRQGFTAGVACQVDVLGYLEGNLLRIGNE